MINIIMWLASHLGNIMSIIAVVCGSLYTTYSMCEYFVMVHSEYSTYGDNRNLAQVVYTRLCSQLWFCNSFITWNNKQCPSGLLVGRHFRYVAHVHLETWDGRRHISITMKTFRFQKSIIQDILDDIEKIEMGEIFNDSRLNKNIQKHTIIHRKSTHHSDNWKTQEVIAYRSLDCVPEQSSCSASLLFDHVKEQGFAGGVYLLCGPPGSGKTLTCKLLAIKLDAVLCLNFNPSKPGQVLPEILAASPPTRSKPCIIVIEEVDRIFQRFGQITEHPTLITPVTNKDDWNNLLEYVHAIENVILILTSNMTLNELSTSFDPALTRNYRITKKLSFTEKMI